MAGLVADHMRMAYSIPNDREYIRSGYSSEPILAVASASLMRQWDDEQMRPNPAVRILSEHLDEDLLARSKIGDIVGRLLLTTDTRESYRDQFSRPRCAQLVPVNNFIRSLFPENVAEMILESVPDNLPPTPRPAEVRANDIEAEHAAQPVTFAEAFKDAVINFTHFAEFADRSTIDQHTALGCFVRGMALICENNGLVADAFIPVCMDPSKPLVPTNMSGFIVQFKLLAEAGTLAAYASVKQETLGLFPKVVGNDGPPLRPYVALFMELGVTHPPPPLSRTSDNSESDYDSQEAQKNTPAVPSTGKQHAGEPEPAPAAKTPSEDATPDAPSRGRARYDHPRYSIYAYGCSATVYRVIREHEHPLYRKILRTRTDGRSRWLATRSRSSPPGMRAGTGSTARA